MLCTFLESENELKMREYLLYPHKRWNLGDGKFFIVRNVESLWPFFLDKSFLCIHLMFDNKFLIRNPKISTFSKEEIKKIIESSNL